MCYSALVKQDVRDLERRFYARADWAAIAKLFKRRREYGDVKISRAFEDNFNEPATQIEREIQADILAYREQLTKAWETDLFKQRKRLADAQRSLKTKETKKSREDERISSSKIETLMERLADLRRTEKRSSDGRIFPMVYAPVVITEGNERVIRPMRYTCRLAGKPANYDVRYPGTYNARRDNLNGFWSEAYGAHHGIIVVSSFYENVARNDYEKRELAEGERPSNIILQFKPQPPVEMVIACLWSHWSGKDEEDLDSFAAITDEPPPEIAETGHNRCIITLTPENEAEWLKPDGIRKSRIEEILSSRPQLIYKHRVAA